MSEKIIKYPSPYSIFVKRVEIEKYRYSPSSPCEYKIQAYGFDYEESSEKTIFYKYVGSEAKMNAYLEQLLQDIVPV